MNHEPATTPSSKRSMFRWARTSRWVAGSLLFAAIACGGSEFTGDSDPSDSGVDGSQGGSGGTAGSGTGGSAATGGTAGGGAGGTAGATASGGTSGATASGGTGGTAGSASGGVGGGAGDAGASGTAGSSGGVGGATGGTGGDSGGVGGGTTTGGVGGATGGAGGVGGVTGGAGGVAGATGGTGGAGGAGGATGGAGGVGGATGGTGGVGGATGGTGGATGGAGGTVDACVPITWFKDDDNDDYGRSTSTTTSCDAPAGNWATHGGDCNDDLDAVHPGQETHQPEPFSTSGSSTSYDYDCSGSETADPSQLGAAPNCGLLALGNCGGSGYLPTNRAGAGQNPLCGSNKVQSCVVAGVFCNAQVATVSVKLRCK